MSLKQRNLDEISTRTANSKELNHFSKLKLEKYESLNPEVFNCGFAIHCQNNKKGKVFSGVLRNFLCKRG